MSPPQPPQEPTPVLLGPTEPHPALGRNAALARASQTAATISLRFLLVLAAVVLIGFLLGQVWIVVLPLLLALLLTTVLWPPVRWLRHRGWPPVLAATSVLLLSVAVLAGVVTALAPQVTGQTQELANSVVGGLGDLQARLARPPFNLDQDAVGGAVNSVIGQAQANAQNVAGRVVSGVGVVGNVVIEGLLALVLTFFFLKDGPRFLPWFSRLTGPSATPHLEVVAERAWRVLGGFIRAQAAVGLVDAIFIGIGLIALGVPLALPLIVLIFFTAFIPIVGAVFSGVLAALVALVSQGPTEALIVLGIVLVVQQLEGNLLQPLLVGRTLNLHPVVVLLSVTAGGALQGITGAFLAVPVVSVLAVLIRYVREALGDPHMPAPPEADPDQPQPRRGITRLRSR